MNHLSSPGLKTLTYFEDFPCRRVIWGTPVACTGSPTEMLKLQTDVVPSWVAEGSTLSWTKIVPRRPERRSTKGQGGKGRSRHPWQTVAGANALRYENRYKACPQNCQSSRVAGMGGQALQPQMGDQVAHRQGQEGLEVGLRNSMVFFFFLF